MRGVFDSVAPKYDVMNDLMSMGLHRVWKAYAVAVAGARPGDKVLDIAGGTGDLARAFVKPVGPSGTVVLTDINEAMLKQGRDRLLDRGHRPADDALRRRVAAFRDRHLRPRERRLRPSQHDPQGEGAGEMARVLRVGGRLLVLEFSKVAAPLAKAYDWYSFKVLPRIGAWVAGDGESYRYLAESIRVHPDQETLKAMMKSAGFGHVDVHNLSAGVVALHVGIKC